MERLGDVCMIACSFMMFFVNVIVLFLAFVMYCLLILYFKVPFIVHVLFCNLCECVFFVTSVIFATSVFSPSGKVTSFMT